ncbi:MAG: coenzyme F420-0:L-glutamate ligase [Erysipelotrichaceae bacterium]|nr:coenzyme F420-0:L-glutamate ligase [Erysipelotrichaceae bacterium]
MERYVGTVSRGIRCPIIKEGDDLSEIIPATLMKASESANIVFHDRDIIAMTESIVARAQGNYCTIEDIAQDIRNKMPAKEAAVIFPITSRNRFAILLKGMAKAFKKVYLMFSYPSDEVGNALLTIDELDEKNVNPYSDVLSLEKYRELFGTRKHEFTGVDYIDYYKQLIEGTGCEAEIIFANNPKAILAYTKNVINCDIHTRKRTKRVLRENGAENVLGLDDIMTSSINGSGYNETYGLLGSNKATEDKVKLFPRDAQNLVEDIQEKMLALTGKKMEVMVYGDGAFKDPQGKIWELADPVVSPFYTEGLKGTPNELKIKYLADNNFADLQGEELKEAIKSSIKEKDGSLVGKMVSEGTTPRQLTDLIGSLCDLTSGSGDKGTPVVFIQGYFDNYTTE